MNWDAIGAVAEAIAALAVIISLLYLAIQVNQNTRTIKNQALKSARERFLVDLDSATSTQIDADIFRRGLNNFNNLSPSDQGSFHSKMHTITHAFHHAWDLNKDGLLPEHELDAMRDVTVSYLMSPGAQQWWAVHKSVPPPNIVSYLDSACEAADGRIVPAIERFPWLRTD